MRQSRGRARSETTGPVLRAVPASVRAGARSARAGRLLIFRSMLSFRNFLSGHSADFKSADCLWRGATQIGVGCRRVDCLLCSGPRGRGACVETSRRVWWALAKRSPGAMRRSSADLRKNVRSPCWGPKGPQLARNTANAAMLLRYSWVG